MLYKWHPGEMFCHFQGKAEGSQGEWASFWKQRNLRQTTPVKYTVNTQTFHAADYSCPGKGHAGQQAAWATPHPRGGMTPAGTVG